MTTSWQRRKIMDRSLLPPPLHCSDSKTNRANEPREWARNKDELVLIILLNSLFDLLEMQANILNTTRLFCPDIKYVLLIKASDD